MNRIRVSNNFYLDEFIDPYMYFTYTSNGYNELDKRLIEIAQLLREKYDKPLYINTWWRMYKSLSESMEIKDIITQIEETDYYKNRKIYKWTGTRNERTTIGSKKSAHRLFKAIDPKGKEKILYDIVKNNAKEFYDLGVRRLEDINTTKGWLHIDTLETSTHKVNNIKVITKTEVKEYILAI